jgi:hypothetical protein
MARAIRLVARNDARGPSDLTPKKMHQTQAKAWAKFSRPFGPPEFPHVPSIPSVRGVVGVRGVAGVAGVPGVAGIPSVPGVHIIPSGTKPPTNEGANNAR